VDAVLLSRIQFAITVGFHFLFPPLTIGLAWLLVVIEWRGWRTGDATYVRMGRFFGKLLALTFAVGVASGIVMEFEFGTNWAAYAKFVGDIFGAPLAAEGVLAFFLESGFLGLYLFGRGRVSKGVHWFSILMVAVGSVISAFWILVANSWQQTPAGYVVREGRAELVNFWAAVFNPSTLPRFVHTVDAALICGAFFVAGVAAYRLLKDREDELARRAARLAIVVGLLASVTETFPFGHLHARQVARTQPAKFAAIEGLYSSTSAAPVVLFAYPVTPPPELKATIEIRGLLSWLAFGNMNTRIRGIDEFPPGDRPPLWLTFVSFHNMVLLGLYFIAVMAWGAWLLRRGRLWHSRRFLTLLVVSIPLPLAACQRGGMAAEVGRQPWIVYGLLRTRDAVSPAVPAGDVLFSLCLFAVLYLLLGGLFIYLLVREIRHGPEPAHP
jgi:cytochrome d ubiquinol oxidase subunit I